MKQLTLAWSTQKRECFPIFYIAFDVATLKREKMGFTKDAIKLGVRV